MTGDWRGEWDYADLPQHVRVGRGAWLENQQSFARVRSERDPALVIGDRARIYAWSIFSIEQAGRVDIGVDATLVGALVMCADAITIGPRAVVSYGVIIADADFHPADPDLRRRDAMAHAPQGNRDERLPFPTRPVVVGADARIGIGAILLKGSRIGDGAAVAAGAVVTGTVPDGWGAVGNPAEVVPLPDMP